MQGYAHLPPKNKIRWCCKSKVSCTRTQHNDYSKGSDPDRSIWSLVRWQALTTWPPRLHILIIPTNILCLYRFLSQLLYEFTPSSISKLQCQKLKTPLFMRLFMRIFKQLNLSLNRRQTLFFSLFPKWAVREQENHGGPASDWLLWRLQGVIQDLERFLERFYKSSTTCMEFIERGML